MQEKELFNNFIKAYDLSKVPFEIRVLKSNKHGIMSGYYNDIDKAYSDISGIWRKYTGKQVKKQVFEPFYISISV